MRRTLLVLRALERAPEGRRATELASEFGLSTRTVHRILASLEELGHPLTQEEDGPRRRWRLAGPSAQRLRAEFTVAEALALLWAERATAPGLEETVLAQPLASASDKVRAGLDPQAVIRLMRLAAQLVPVPSPHHDYRNRDIEIATLRRAAERRQTVQLRYRSKGQPPRLRAFDPYAFFSHLGALYVAGHCHRRHAVRTFLVDRIRSVTPTQGTFTQDPTFDAARYFDGAFGVYKGEVATVRLRFAPEVALWATERLWHASQQLRTFVDGAAELTLRVAPTPDLVATILGFGRHVRVEAPKSLAREVAQEWFAAASMSAKWLRGKAGAARPDLSRVGGSVAATSRASKGKGAVRRRKHG